MNVFERLIMQLVCDFSRVGALAFCLTFAIIPSVAASQEALKPPGAAVSSLPQAKEVKLWNEFYYGMTPESVIEL